MKELMIRLVMRPLKAFKVLFFIQFIHHKHVIVGLEGLEDNIHNPISVTTEDEESGDALDELLAAMSPIVESEEEEDSISPVQDETDDEDVSEEDENWYEEQNHDVDSVVIPVNTTELFNFPAMQLVTLVNHPVLVKDAHHQLCIAHFGYRLFVDVTEDQKRALCAEISRALCGNFSV